ncbi:MULTISPECIES: DUF1820 family protein [unclassified Wenzhouxiangella]|uniref:DUF1820 family protein n=1 Tax=unclassified Wenzhouxiangella TaxID=2613841 RepID=UPI000E326FBC|nr:MULTISPECIES: DUF1820 family protein [unclassified Wenzhouxiangella]RFF26831.1 DUF1820 family protein [Wenzhouxiangella sp. 15181]RFP68516.1 DUF1820 family protein [Wenzhouxiangella sp. 15190]
MPKLYKVSFLNQGQVYELYCRKVAGSDLSYGFVEISELVFETDDSVVIDPTEERLREEFADVEVLHLPMHSVIRVEEVKKRGTAAIRDSKSGEKVTPLPVHGPHRKR